MSIRDVLLAVYGVGWLAAVLITVWRTGTVPPELWAVLGIGVGALLAAFKVDNSAERRRGGGNPPAADASTEEANP